MADEVQLTFGSLRAQRMGSTARLCDKLDRVPVLFHLCGGLFILRFGIARCRKGLAMVFASTKKNNSFAARLVTALGLLILFLFFHPHAISSAQNSKRAILTPILKWTLGTLKFRNFDVVTTFTVSPSGKLIASAGGDDPTHDYSIYIWNVETGALIKRMHGHEQCVNSLVFLNDDIVVSCSNDRTLRKWKLSGPDNSERLHKADGRLLCMALTPDRNALVIGGDGCMVTWGIRENKVLRCEKLFESSITCIACSPSGKMIAYDGPDNAISLIDRSTGKSTQTLVGHGRWISSIDFSPDSSKIVSTGYDSTIRLWDLPTGTQLKSYSCKNAPPNTKPAIFSEDGSRIYAVFDDALFALDAKELKVTKKLSKGPIRVQCLKIIPKKKILIGAGEDRFHYFFNTESGELINPPSGHLDSVASVAFSLDDDTVWSGCDAGYVIGWDVKTGNQICKRSIHDSRVTGISMVGKDSFVSSSADKSIAFVKYRSKEMDVQRSRFSEAFFSITPAYRSTNVIVAAERKLFGFNYKSGEIQRKPVEFADRIGILALSPSKHHVAIAADSPIAIFICDVGTGKVLKKMTKHEDYIFGLAYSSDGNLLASASRDGSVIVWDADSGKPILEANPHLAEARSIGFFAGNCGLISAGWDRRIVFSDLRTKTIVCNLKDVPFPINAIAVSHDGSKLAVGDYRGLVTVWDMTSVAHEIQKSVLRP
jgi:WD40 repeat protein